MMILRDSVAPSPAAGPPAESRFRSTRLNRSSARVVLITVTGLALALATPAIGATGKQAETPLAPGDTVRIAMMEDPDVSFEGAISITGTVPLPYLREVKIAGITPKDAEKEIAAELLKSLYNRATVSVVLLRRAAGKVYVYGAVKNPGVMELPPAGQVTVMQLISEMGGLTSWADPDRAYILRQHDENEDAERIPVNLNELFSESARQIYVPLEPGDIFFVPGIDGSTQQVMTTDESEVIVVGEVNAPGIILFAPGEQRTVMRAIFKSGGFTKFAKSKEVRLIRYGKDGSRSEQTINVSAVIDDGFLDQDVDLLPGDMLIVPQKMLNF